MKNKYIIGYDEFDGEKGESHFETPGEGSITFKITLNKEFYNPNDGLKLPFLQRIKKFFGLAYKNHWFSQER